MSEQTWRETVKKYEGAFVVWVDQGTDPLLKANSSKGVCFAMSFDFVTAYQAGQPAPGNFVNDIRGRALVWPKTSRIPTKYLDIQDASRAMLNQYTDNHDLLELELEVAEQEDKPAIQKKLDQLKEYRIKQRYGPGMELHDEFEKTDASAMTELFTRMKTTVTKNGPSYFLVEMRGSTGTGGHAVAFGFRNDLSTPSFPAIYEFFDANLGLFVFKSDEKLADFFIRDVWRLYYSNKSYSRFSITSYPAKKGKR
jgi:hypothetical protein